MCDREKEKRPQTLALAAAGWLLLPSSSLPSPPSEDAANEVVLPTTDAGPLAALLPSRELAAGSGGDAH
jgi:hypothetical protein